MKRTAFLAHMSPGAKFLWFILMVILSSLVFGLLGLLLGKIWLHVDTATLSQMFLHPEEKTARPFLYAYQFINQIGVFILPPLFFAWLVDKNSRDYLQLNHWPKLYSIILGTILVYALLPFVNWLTDLNAQVRLPETLAGLEQWMKAKELQADTITKAFLSVKTLGALGINLLIIALVPAIGEELLFRGVIQRLLGEWTKNIHWGIFLTAIIFSAIHMQFYGFFPRFVLGLVLGYIFAISQNLWLAMLVHFVNNASSVIIFYLNYNGFIAVKMENFGAVHNWFGIAASILISLWLLILIAKKENKVLLN